MTCGLCSESAEGPGTGWVLTAEGNSFPVCARHMAAVRANVDPVEKWLRPRFETLMQATWEPLRIMLTEGGEEGLDRFKNSCMTTAVVIHGFMRVGDPEYALKCQFSADFCRFAIIFFANELHALVESMRHERT